MENFGMPSSFWTELFIILSVVILLAGVIPAISRYKLGADKKKWFSFNYINKFHKKVDRVLRIVFVTSIIVSVIFFSSQPILIYITPALFIVSQISVQIYMEVKYSDNRKNVQVSLIELILTIISLVGAFYWTDYFL